MAILSKWRGSGRANGRLPRRMNERLEHFRAKWIPVRVKKMR
ncbi:hypothetical protein BOSEA1005_11687 [Hyphomicrobiales bacterium]|nr:hypothetical protein BOSEA1005_11687 [Hyphomicrobiales bacterium]